MNNWNGIGRLTRDVEVRYTAETQMAIATFTMAIDDGFGEKKTTNFIPVVCFGKTAESCEKFLAKGKLVGVTGKIKTGSYLNKDKVKVYTTDINADRVDFLEWGEKEDKPKTAQIPEGFMAIDEDDELPFG